MRLLPKAMERLRAAFAPRYGARAFGVAILLWTAVVGLSLTINWRRVESSAESQAAAEARSSFNKDLVYRRWAAMRGGLYASPTPEMPPNPYLAHLPDRDITTTDGKRLTLINPAYMTRQVHELGKEQYGVRGHITSLQPLRPENGPDDWEAAALRSFARGVTEVRSVTSLSGQPHLRFMRPMVTEESCLKCHRAQQYKVGDIQGGISVSVPLEPYYQVARQRQWMQVLSHSVTYLLGLACIVFARNRAERAHAKLAQSEERFRSLFDASAAGALVYGEDGVLAANPALAALFGFASADELAGGSLQRIFAPASVETLRSCETGQRTGVLELQGIRPGGLSFEIEAQVAPIVYNGRPAIIASCRDITSQRRAEEALEATNARLNLAISSGELGIWDWDISTGALMWDERMHAIYGLEPGQFTGGVEVWRNTLHPEDREPAVEAVRAALRGECKYSHRYRALHPNGEVRHVQAEGVVVRDSSGNPVRMIGLNHDVTERVRIEDSLRESEYWLQESQRVSQIGSYVLDVNGRSWKCSPVLDQIFGIDAEYPHTTEGWANVLHPEDREFVLSYFAGDVVAKRLPFDLEYRIVRLNDGAARWVHGRGALVETAGGGLMMAGTIQDITVRKEAELALRATEDRYQALFEQAGDGVCLMDADGAIVSVNETFSHMHGYAVDEVMALDPQCMDVGGSPATRRFASLRDGETLHFEVERRHKDGHTFPVAVTANRIHAGDQQLILTMHRDISSRKRAEAEREQLWTQLAQAQKMESVGRLAGGVAHDFNNLLTVINGYCAMTLRNLREGDPLREVLEEIHRAGERAAALTKQLLAFSRKQILQPRPLGLNEVALGMESMLRRLMGEDVELVYQLSPDSPRVNADPHQLEQVLMNLAVNARDAMPGGGSLTIATATDSNGGEQRACLAVTDSGFGMDAETVEHIFEPFFTTKAGGRGTGLGLSMVQGIVEQSGGRITVESQPGRGSTFRVCLPLLTEEASRAPADNEAAELEGQETVLVVEDQAEVRAYTVKVLQLFGYRPIAAANAGEAFLLAEQRVEPIHLLLTDIVMPHISGTELAASLLRLRPTLRVLYMSGYTDDVVLRHGVMQQNAHFVQKPFSPQDLVSAVREALR